MEPSSFVVIVNCQSKPLPFADHNHDPAKTATLRFNQTHLSLQGYYERRSFSCAALVNEIIPLGEIQDVVFFGYKDTGPAGVRFTHIRERSPERRFYMVPKNPGELVSIVALLLTNKHTESVYEEVKQKAARFQARRKNPLVEEQKAAEFMKKASDAVRFPFVTGLLFAACVVVYILMGIEGGPTSWEMPSSELLISFGSDYGPLTYSNQPWRMLTNTFVHLGCFHLIGNMIFLVVSGLMAERFFGHFSFALIYIGSGITGSLASLFIHPYFLSCGASGAVFGIYGSLVAYGVVNSNLLPPKVYNRCIWGTFYFLIYNLIYVSAANVDNAAHIGGLAGGFLFGLAASIPSQNDTFPVRGLAPLRALLLTALVLCVCCFGFWGLKNTDGAKFCVESGFYYEETDQIVNLWNAEIEKFNEKKISDKDYAQYLEKTILPRFLKLQSMESRLTNLNQDKAIRENLAFHFKVAEYRIRILQRVIEGRKTDNFRAIQEGEYLIEFLNDCNNSNERVFPNNNEENMNYFLDFLCMMNDRESPLNEQLSYLEKELEQKKITNETLAAKIKEEILPEWENIYLVGDLVNKSSLCKEKQKSYDKMLKAADIHRNICKKRLQYIQTGIDVYSCEESLLWNELNLLNDPESVPQTPEYTKGMQLLEWYVDLFHTEQKLPEAWKRACEQRLAGGDESDSALRHLEYDILNDWKNREESLSVLDLSLFDEENKKDFMEKKTFIAQIISLLNQGVQAFKDNDKSAMVAIGESIDKELAAEVERMKQ